MYMYCMFVRVHMPSDTDEQGHCPLFEAKGGVY